MSKKRQYAKENIDQALLFIKNKEGSIREAAKRFNVPRSSVQFKLKNPDTKFKSGPDPILTQAEEEALCEFIIRLCKCGFPRKKEDIQDCVQNFIKKNPRPNPFRDGRPGNVWFNSFMKRHPNIAIRTSEGVSNASACVSERDIRKWFLEIREYIDNEGLNDVIKDPNRVFNADETGFNICPKTGKVLAEKGCKNVYQVEKGSSKENITVMFTFSAAGLVCKPMIIFPYKRIPDRVSLSVPSGWGIGRSDSGWMTATVFYDYIENSFYPQLLTNDIPLPVILFVDGHKTHITIEVAELCRSLQIHLVALYPNATRILQPADVSAFRPIKVGWRKALREWYAANNYETNFTKEKFAPLLKSVIDSSAKKETLVNGFRICGLFPFNADNVDYNKCIAATKGANYDAYAPATGQNSDNDLYKMPYSDFTKLAGSSIIKQCEIATHETLQNCSEYLKVIYRVWQKFNGLALWEENHNNISVHNIWTGEDAFDCLYIRDQASSVIEDDECLMNNVILDELTGELKEVAKKIEKLEKNTENSCILSNESPKQIETDKEPFLLNTDTDQLKDIPNCKKVQVISNISLAEYLEQKCPDSPKRKGKRETERLPFVLTSDSYVARIKAKKLKKQEEEVAKQNRKRIREEKKKQKEESANKILKKGKVDKKSTYKKMNTHLMKESKVHRIHIPEDEDDEFLCKNCYEVGSDSSNGDELVDYLMHENKKHGL